MCIIQITLFVLAILAFEVNSFTTCQRISSHSKLTITTNENDRNKRLNLFTEQQQLEIWVTTFSAAHIGMSAVRDDIINGFGELASNLKAVDRGFKLPSYWPGELHDAFSLQSVGIVIDITYRTFLTPNTLYTCNGMFRR